MENTTMTKQENAILTFLGSGAAFTVGEENYQSNMILEYRNKKLLIDCGSDIRLSLFEQKLTHHELSAVFISHLHGDHVGGLEWLAFKCKFENEGKKLPLYLSEELVHPLWNTVLKGGLSSIKELSATLDTFFMVHTIKNNLFTWNDLPIKTVPTIHFCSNSVIMPTYGIFFTINGENIWITDDTQFTPDHLQEYYQKADIIFHDCETSKNKSNVHAHYSELVNLPTMIKNKIWLYHYNPGPLPDAISEGFKGFVKRGQSFIF
jgi:ribonuclease BN (tRNA processing enzyme)